MPPSPAERDKLTPRRPESGGGGGRFSQESLRRRAGEGGGALGGGGGRREADGRDGIQLGPMGRSAESNFI